MVDYGVSILFGYYYALNSRELICWMFANLNVYLVTKANNDRVNFP